MQNDKQAHSPYTTLDFCYSQQDFTQTFITRKDLGNTGTFINYSMAIAQDGSIRLLKDYMESYGISENLREFYRYKIMVNFGVFSFLFKKVEGKDNERAIKEAGFEVGSGIVSYNVLKRAAKNETIKATTKAVSRFSMAMAGRILGSYAGSVVPIAGTIIGAIVGGWIAGKIEEWWFSDEDEALAEARAENERIEKLKQAYNLKIDRINNYLITHHYVELRVLNESEAEIFCKEASNLQSSYFKTILLMLSFPNYLDKDEKEYKKSQEKNPTKIRIQPVADALKIKVQIKKCFLSKNGEFLKNKEIYVYNHRFDRVVAKAISDNEGNVVFDDVSVGKENTIDKISFIIDRENFNEENFYESVLKYAPIFNVQKSHKQKEQALINRMYFSFTTTQDLMQDNEVLELKAFKDNAYIIFDYEVRKQEESYKNYIILSYLTFDIKEDIKEYICHIAIENRAFRGLEFLSRGLQNKHIIKDEWKDKGVVFFAYFNSQKSTPYKKMVFIDKPIVIIDIEDSNKENISGIMTHFLFYAEAFKIFVVDLNTYAQQEKIAVINNIKRNIENLDMFYIKLKLSNSKDANVSKIEYSYNGNKYANKEVRFIEFCKERFFQHHKNNTKKSNSANDVDMPFVTIDYSYDKEKFNNKGFRQNLGLQLAFTCQGYFYSL